MALASVRILGVSPALISDHVLVFHPGARKLQLWFHAHLVLGVRRHQNEGARNRHHLEHRHLNRRGHRGHHGHHQHQQVDGRLDVAHSCALASSQGLDEVHQRLVHHPQGVRLDVDHLAVDHQNALHVLRCQFVALHHVLDARHRAAFLAELRRGCYLDGEHLAVDHRYQRCLDLGALVLDRLALMGVTLAAAYLAATRTGCCLGGGHRNGLFPWTVTAELA